MARQISRGFTLIEVLIALAITALVATLSFSSLSAVLSSVESLRSQGERISGLNRAWTIMARDLRQFAGRPMRNEFGLQESPIWGGAGADSGLVFTRRGWHNPNRQLRSSLQRVSYRLEDDVLWRENYTVLDRVNTSEPQRVRLLEGVEDFEVVFLLPDQLLQGDAIDTSNGQTLRGPEFDESSPAALPRAVELRLTLADWGELTWLHELRWLDDKPSDEQ